MRTALLIYWIWHLTTMSLGKLYITDSIVISNLITHFSYASIWFICIYAMATMYVMQEKINHRVLWWFISSLIVRAVVFHLQIIASQTFYNIIIIYGFGLFVFLLLEKSFAKLMKIMGA